MPCKRSFSERKASVWTLRFSSSLRLLSARVDVRWVAEKELFLVGGGCIEKPLMCDTLTPFDASFYSNYLTRPFSLYIFCWRPFHPFSSDRAWSISKLSPSSLAMTRLTLLTSVFMFCILRRISIIFFSCSAQLPHFVTLLAFSVFSRDFR